MSTHSLSGGRRGPGYKCDECKSFEAPVEDPVVVAIPKKPKVKVESIFLDCRECKKKIHWNSANCPGISKKQVRREMTLACFVLTPT